MKDRQEFLAALAAFRTAAQAVNDAWDDANRDDPNMGVTGYPFKEDFDQVESDIVQWSLAQEREVQP